MQNAKICASLFSRILRKGSSIMSTDAKHIVGGTVRRKCVLGTILKSWGFICIIDQII